MAQKNLNRVQVDAPLEQARGIAVAQRVGRNPFAQSRSQGRLAARTLDRSDMDRVFARSVRKQLLSLGAACPVVGPQGLEQRR